MGLFATRDIDTPVADADPSFVAMRIASAAPCTQHRASDQPPEESFVRLRLSAPARSLLNRRIRLGLFMSVALAACRPAGAGEVPADAALTGEARQAGCEAVDARACVELAIQAMGGRQKLAGIRAVRYQTIGHTAVTEQSYRQQPFVTAYEHDVLTIDFANGRLVDASHGTWPESDPGQFENDQTLVATSAGCVYRGSAGAADTPCGLADLEQAADAFALGPERLLLTASAAGDLRYAPPRWLRATRHAVVEFDWHGRRVQVYLNAVNHLPDALQSTRTFQDFWFAWGDVRQRVYFDNWHLVGGIVLPSNRVEVRNDIAWQSTQVTEVAIDPPLEDSQFAMDAQVAAKAAQSPGWNRTFSDKARVELAPGISLYRGSWNATLVRQDDGVLVIEAPISGSYMQGLLAKAGAEFPQAPVKAVLSTSDSWPHVAGVREAVAQGLPVVALDLNRPELDGLVAAPHSMAPDSLQKAARAPRWISAGTGTEIGHGDNRVVLYPLQGASTERQYMVYFPARRLLYASDTLALNPDRSLYDPQLMHEVVQAVERNGLAVDTVYAMHAAPMAWKDVVAQVRRATN